ncbi:MAG: Rieske 2Fe-2S domain-containing protein [Chloroflexota bacterium]
MTDVAKSWVRLCTLDELPEQKAVELNINGQRLVIARCGESVSVLQGYCSHMLFPLAGSRVDDCVLVCSLHESSFNVRDGSVAEWSSFPAFTGKALAAIRDRKALRTYETRTTNGDVYVLWSANDPESVNVRIKV